MNKLLLWLVFVYLVIFPFGQLGRIELIPPITLHSVDIAAFAFVFFWLISLAQRRVLPNPPLKQEFLAFLAVAGFSLFLGSAKVAWQEALVGFLYLFRFLVYMLFYFGIWDLVRQDSQLRARLFNALVVVGASISIFGLFQYLLFPDLRILLSYGWDEHYFRLVGTFLDPGFTGILIVLFLILVFSRTEWARLDSARQGRMGEKVLLSFLGITALLLTYSRASYLAFLGTLLCLNIVRRNTKFVLIILTLFILGIAVLPRPGGEGVYLERTSTVFARFESYRTAWETALKNPLFGTGFNLYAFVQETTKTCGNIDPGKPCHSVSGADSSLLFVFATGGVVGLLAYLYLWWRIFIFGWRKRFTAAGLALLLSSVALLVHSNFSNSLFYPWVLGWQAILLGIQED